MLNVELGRGTVMKTLSRQTTLLTSAYLAGAIVVYTQVPAFADCSTSDTTITCTGDLSSGETIDASDITDITIDSLTTDTGKIEITSSTDDAGNDGYDGYDADDTTGFTVSFDGDSTYGIDSDSGDAIDIEVTAGDGGAGGGSNIQGGDGGDGGSVGATTLEISDTTTFEGEDNVIYYVTVGGHGGEGGEGKNTASSSGDGGEGGHGGDGGDQTVEVISGELTQMNVGEGSFIYMSSQGGKGGQGGEGKGEGINATDVNAGKGRSGGDGGDVSITLSTTAAGSTTSDDTPGVRVESLGGAGGEGGKASGGDIKGDGGNGGDGGAAGTVTVDFSTATITTSGDRSIGLLVRSYGGGGGEGGESETTNGSDGDGGSGGDGGDVTATFGGTITTGGEDATGVLVQSVGGFGADAGSSDVTSYGASDEDGGHAGSATFTLSDGGIISTSNDGADGVHVQSVGGSGGKGQSSDSISAIGGSGSAGGAGGTVIVTIGDSTQITTTEEHANALVAMSVGGGGGSGGSAEGVTSVGGSGGKGGDGGDVTVTIGTATMTTGQVASYGVYAASIGGGGGKARSTTGISAIGGSGGDGGDAGTVTANLNGLSITTTVDDSAGIVLQSIGGGGGSGANAVAAGATYSRAVGGSGGSGGDGAAITVTSDSSTIGSIETESNRSKGFAVQSIGGGGGIGGDDWSVSSGLVADYTIGSSGGGGDGGDGGTVTVEEFYNTITTKGDHSHGVVAQSIGGSGGNSGSTATYSAVSAVDLTDTVGSSGGGGGTGNTVTLTLNESISTEGDKSHGVLAQSIGGGGGSSGHTFAGSSISGGSIDSTTGGSGGSGNAAGEVSVTVNADLTTTGDGSDGILAQSIGGGGGSSGWTSNVDTLSGVNTQTTVGGSGGSGGTGNTVTVNYDNDTAMTVSGDNSVGIRAQSIGGGGGHSDATVTGDISSAAELSFATGGQGGKGGNAGEVTVTVDGTITVEGDNGAGIMAQSIAASGGSSGLSVNGDVDLASLSFTAEGSGGSGGTADDVTITNNAALKTEGDHAPGLIAQSIGGGGGSATGVITGEITMAKLSASVGGSGGDGGTSGKVTVTSTESITTSGVHSTGILAHSIGGDGGNGGYSIDGSISAGEYTGNVSVSVGGDGGSGGTADEVYVDNSGGINTSEYAARGIFAQSIGGSGGNAGSVYSGQFTLSSGKDLDWNLTVGGSGGSSGSGGYVEVINSGDITTESFYADGIFAQSIGGSGGAGGNSYAFTAAGNVNGGINSVLSIGGDAGDGAVGGDVYIHNDGGTIQTSKGSSSGIFAQSIGGNGGAGGFAASLLLDATTSSGGTLDINSSIALGGTGGTGGDAGTVGVDNDGDITVVGNAARGVFAQSIGGGGGSAGSSDAYLLSVIMSASSDDTNVGFNLDISIGGTGGSGGDGNTVTIENSETIQTSGIAGYGIFGQSIGGGGGNGGDASSAIDDFDAVLEAAIDAGGTADESTFEQYLYTAKDVAEDIYESYLTVLTASDVEGVSKMLTEYELSVGGSSGSAGDGDEVSVTNSGSIITTGDSGTAIFAQSVGGGGGAGGDGSGDDLTDLTVGGDGSGGGDGGEIYVEHTGTIETSGAGAMGIFAQSVGGGGGAGGDVELVFSESFTSDSFGIGVVAASNSGSGGDGGEIIIDVGGTITTTGDQAHGIWAQSIGGSGGALGADNADTLTETIVGNAGDEGDGGDIQVTVTAAMNLSGDYSTAIFTQSLGGDGDDGGDITIDIDADVSSSGTGGWGIVAQSDGYNSGGDVTIKVYSDKTLSTGGTDVDSNEAIYILGAGDATIENDGTITNENMGEVIAAEDTRVIIENDGTIYGNIELADDENNFFKAFAGTLESGDKLDLGDSGTYRNQGGTLSPGGENNVQTTKFTGEWSSTYNTGILLFDVDLTEGIAETYDLFIFETSTSPRLNGTLEINVTDSSLISSGESGYAYIAEAVSDSASTFDIDDLTVSDSATVDYSVSVVDDLVEVSYTVDYSAGDTLSGNSAIFAAFMDDIVDYTRDNLPDGSAGRTAIEDLTSFILNIPDDAALNDAYDSYVINEAAASVVNAVSSALNTHNLLQSCPVLEQDPNSRFYRQRECVWSQLIGGYSSQDRTSNNPGYDAQTYGMALGAQREVADDLFLEIAGNYEMVHLDGSNFSQDGYQLGVGAALKKEFGPLVLSASANLGGYSLDHVRAYETSSGQYQASGDVRGHFIGGELRAYSVHLKNGFYVKPSAAVSVVQTWQDGFTETGTGGLEWMVDPISKTSVAVRPSLELGAAFDISGQPATAFVRGGLTAFVSDPDTTATSYLAGDAFLDMTGIETTLSEDRYIGELDLGVNVDLTDRMSVSVLGQGLFSKTAYSAGGYGRLKIQF